MANKKITELPSATTFNASDVTPIVQGGTTKQVTKTNMLTGYVTETGTQTLTNKTLTSPILTTPVLNTPVLNTSLSGTAFLDEDDMVSDSNNKVASQQSIKYFCEHLDVNQQTTDYTMVAGDVRKVIEYTSATAANRVFTLLDAATYTEGWLVVLNNSSYTVTITPAGADTVNGASSYVLEAGDSVVILSKDTNWSILNKFVATLPFANNYLHVRDEKTVGTDGGTFTLGAHRTRDLNTVKDNTISGASLATNQVTLPAGTYYMEAHAPAWRVGFHQLFWYNTTDTADEIIGENATSATTANSVTHSFVSGFFTIATQKVFELQHESNATKTTDGFGRACGFGTEVYSEVRIWRIA